jgi:hypothetical protein
LRFIDLFLTTIAALVFITVVALIVSPAAVKRSALRIRHVVLPSATEREPYAVTFAGAGGRPPYSWAVAPGALLPGLRLAPATGELSGTAADSGTMRVELALRDSAGSVAKRRLKLVVRAIHRPEVLRMAAPVAVLPEAVSSEDYRHVFKVSGGAFPYRFSVPHGSLPDGLKLSAGGVLHGRLKLEASDRAFAHPRQLAVTVRDANGKHATQRFELSLRHVTHVPAFLRAIGDGLAFVVAWVVGPTLVVSLLVLAGVALAGSEGGIAGPYRGALRRGS